jgi:hypothetical protein
MKPHHAARIGATIMLQRHGTLDQPLIEVVLEPVRGVPDVLPDLVGLEKLVLVE